MSLKPLTLHTASALHTFGSYTIPSQQVQYALHRYVRPVTNRWPGARGDMRAEARALTVTLSMVAGSLLDVTHDALDLIDDLATVHFVGCHMGDYAAVGLLSYSFGVPQGAMLPVTLTFAVTDFYGFRPELDNTAGWSSTSVVSTLGVPNTNPAFMVPGMPVLRTTKPSPVVPNDRTWRTVNAVPGFDPDSVEALIVLRTSRDLPTIASPLRFGVFVGNASETTTLTLAHMSPYAGQFRLSLVDEDANVVMSSFNTTVLPSKDTWVAFKVSAVWEGAGLTRFKGKAWTASSNPAGEPGWQVNGTRLASFTTRVGMTTSGLYFSEVNPPESVDIGYYVVTFGGVPTPRIQL